MEQELAAGLGEGQIAELIEDYEVHPGQLISNPALPPIAGLGLETIDEIDDVVEAAAWGTHAIRSVIAISTTKKSPSPIDVHVGSRVRMRRMMLGMSQEKLAEAFGFSFQQVQKYEKGTNRMGSSRLQQAAAVLDVPVSFFFEDTENQAVEHATLPPGYVDEFVASRDGVRLIKAFTRIDNDAMRRQIVSLVEELALRDGK